MPNPKRRRIEVAPGQAANAQEAVPAGGEHLPAVQGDQAPHAVCPTCGTYKVGKSSQNPKD